MKNNVNVAEIVSSQICDFIGRTGLLPWHENRSVFRNFATGEAFNLLNNCLLFIHKHSFNLNSHLYGTYKQISEFGGRVADGTQGSIATYYKVGDGSLFLRYYWLFGLEQTNGLYADFKNVEYVDCEDEGKKILTKIETNLGEDNPITRSDFSNFESFYIASIKKLIGLLSRNKDDDGLVNKLVGCYLLMRCGIKPDFKYTKREAQSLAERIKYNPYWLVSVFNQAHHYVNNLLN
jgi:hypothetical protein